MVQKVIQTQKRVQTSVYPRASPSIAVVLSGDFFTLAENETFARRARSRALACDAARALQSSSAQSVFKTENIYFESHI